MRKVFGIVWVGFVLSAVAGAYEIRFENTGRGRTVDYVFKGNSRSNFAGDLTFTDLRTNLLFRTMCGDLDNVIQDGDQYNVVEKQSNTMGGGYQKGGTVFAKNIDAANTNNRAAALQIAVWAARYGTNLGTNSGGDFQLDSGWIANNTSIYNQAVSYFNSANQGPANALFLEPSPVNGGQAQYAPVPEPVSLLAMGSGVALLLRRRKFRPLV